MLKEVEFAILNTLRKSGATHQRELAEKAGLSLGTINAHLKRLVERRYVTDLALTHDGLSALEPYKVENAVILAAGLSSRFAPISYERPKGSLVVRGEVLIERTIRQLHEVGIRDITVVVGYMKEQFLYLEEAFGVNIVISDCYETRNNHSSLKVVENLLGNTYVCYPDLYFTENVFEPYVYHAYYGAIFEKGASNEWGMVTGSGGRVVQIDFTPVDEWVMMGEIYFDRQFSEDFMRVLNRVYDLPETASKLWEEIWANHIKELDMHRRNHADGIVFEFDKLDEVRAFDPDFLLNIDSAILNNISAVLECTKEDIVNVDALKKGSNNLSFAFDVGKQRYVYRHPVAGGIDGVNRIAEHEAEKIAEELGVDDLLVYFHPTEAWKITRFVEETRPFDYHDNELVKAAFKRIALLHESKKTIDRVFDHFDETQILKERLGSTQRLSFQGFDALDARNERLHDSLLQEEALLTIQHNNFSELNLIVDKDSVHLIDWEYAAMSDYATDLATLLACGDYTIEESEAVLEAYFDRKPTELEQKHCYAQASVIALFWLVWALDYEERRGSTGKNILVWYQNAKKYGECAEGLYGLNN